MSWKPSSRAALLTTVHHRLKVVSRDHMGRRWCLLLLGAATISSQPGPPTQSTIPTILRRLNVSEITARAEAVGASEVDPEYARALGCMLRPRHVGTHVQTRRIVTVACHIKIAITKVSFLLLSAQKFFLMIVY